MSLEALAVSFGGVLYVLGGIVLFLVCLVLSVVILMQDSKEGGLGGAFGAGMGGEGLLGARGQKDIARFTGYVAAIFAVLVIVLSAADSLGTKEARSLPGDENTIRALPEDQPSSAGAPADAGAGAGAGAGTPSVPEGTPSVPGGN